jgi:hypothetical protein
MDAVYCPCCGIADGNDHFYYVKIVSEKKWEETDDPECNGCNDDSHMYICKNCMENESEIMDTDGKENILKEAENLVKEIKNDLKPKMKKKEYETIAIWKNDMMPNVIRLSYGNNHINTIMEEHTKTGIPYEWLLLKTIKSKDTKKDVKDLIGEFGKIDYPISFEKIDWKETNVNGITSIFIRYGCWSDELSSLQNFEDECLDIFKEKTFEFIKKLNKKNKADDENEYNEEWEKEEDEDEDEEDEDEEELKRITKEIESGFMDDFVNEINNKNSHLRTLVKNIKEGEWIDFGKLHFKNRGELKHILEVMERIEKDEDEENEVKRVDNNDTFTSEDD